jgi:hypothetical protein
VQAGVDAEKEDKEKGTRRKVKLKKRDCTITNSIFLTICANYIALDIQPA